MRLRGAFYLAFYALINYYHIVICSFCTEQCHIFGRFMRAFRRRIIAAIITTGHVPHDLSAISMFTLFLMRAGLLDLYILRRRC